MALSVDRDRLVEEGFVELLTKPCMPPILIAAVRRLIGPAQAGAEEAAAGV
jgi:CheY-like chemotaxis protein